MIEDVNKCNTIYIISKGRPDCTTARTLTRLNYPAPWFIVCGTNDETLDEYKKNWGEHVLVFDWHEEIKHTDTLDNFGFDDMPSGACPVRNSTIRISEQRGEKRHWQFDDDYSSFAYYDYEQNKNIGIHDGNTLYEKLLALANFAAISSFKNVGFGLSSSAFPDRGLKTSKRVFNFHNLPSDTKFATKWRGRLNDDVINAIETMMSGNREISVDFWISGNTTPTQQEAGGLTEFYKQVGTVRKTAYALLINPHVTRLVAKFGRYHHQVNWKKICPEIISEEWRKHD